MLLSFIILVTARAAPLPMIWIDVIELTLIITPKIDNIAKGIR